MEQQVDEEEYYICMKKCVLLSLKEKEKEGGEKVPKEFVVVLFLLCFMALIHFGFLKKRSYIAFRSNSKDMSKMLLCYCIRICYIVVNLGS